MYFEHIHKHSFGYVSHRVQQQKKNLNAKTLDADKVTLLNAIGSDFLKSKTEKWMDKYNELSEYYKVNGANAPISKRDRKNLSQW